MNRRPLRPSRRALARKTPMKRVAIALSSKRRSTRAGRPDPADFARKYGSRERVAFVNTLPCAACGVVGYSENAHVRKPEGLGRKSGYLDIAPLCGVRPAGLASMRGEKGNPGLYAGCHARLDGNANPPLGRVARDVVAIYGPKDTEEAWQAHLACGGQA